MVKFDKKPEHGSDIQENIKLKDILDWKEIQNCLEEFYKLVHLAISIIDIDGNIIVSVGFQEICEKFHRANPETCKNCFSSDIDLTAGVAPGKYKIYKCLNNLYDIVTPLIIDEKHLGNFFVGQIFPEDEPIDLDVFYQQARKYGFDENKYIHAVKKVPVISRSHIDDIMAFISKFSYIVSSEGYKNMQLSRNLNKINLLMRTLKKSEGQYRLLVEHQTDLIIKTDVNLNILYASPSYCHLFGIHEREILGTPYFPIIFERDQPAVDQAISEMMRPPYTCFYEAREKTIHGWRWIQWTGKAVVGEDGEILSLIGSGRDITEKKDLEKEIVENQAKHIAMVANILDVLMITDENLIIEYVSSNIEKLFGWTPQDLYGQKAFQRVQFDDIPKITQMIGDLKNENNFTKTGEFRYLNKNGHYTDVEVTAVNLISDPYINGIMVNFHDITDYKKRENKIKYLSYRDVLTGLYNRAFYEEKIKRLNHENELPVSVIMGDVNGLKIINDGFGHIEGDKVLKRIAKILVSCCRKGDIVCRIGGDEFCILLPKTDLAIAQKICGRIYAKCENINSKQNNIIKLSLSLGVETKTDRHESLLSTIKKAEAFMYRHKLLESRSARSSIISAIKATMYEKSQETERHAERIATLTVALGKKLGLRDEQLTQLELLATLHDLGKMSVDQRILNKRGKLTPSEWIEIKKHPEAGYRIALASPELVHIADYILCHHEHWDGSGYPQGLIGEDIPFLSRIISVVDAYDSMIHDRSYQKAMSKQDTLHEIENNSGTQFDPKVVNEFLNIIQVDAEEEV